VFIERNFRNLKKKEKKNWMNFPVASLLIVPRKWHREWCLLVLLVQLGSGCNRAWRIVFYCCGAVCTSKFRWAEYRNEGPFVLFLSILNRTFFIWLKN